MVRTRRERGFTDKLQHEKWKHLHSQMREVIHNIWYQKFTLTLEKGETPDESTMSRSEILPGLKERGIVIPEKSPTLRKHLKAFVDEEELIECPEGARYPRYRLNVSGRLEMIRKISTLFGTEQPYEYKHLIHQEPRENILEIHAYKPHSYPAISSADTALKMYATRLFVKNGKCIIPVDYLTGRKDPAKMSNAYLYSAFREKKGRNAEAIFKSLSYTEYVVRNQELFHYLRTPEGKKWLVDVLRQQLWLRQARIPS